MIGTLLLNRYELLEKIGEGGMGIVYKAKCHLLNRYVAVKILKKELSQDKEIVARFKREANSVARLSHPNIVNVYDVGEENNINFIVMEYVNGKTLKQVIKENGRLSFEKTLDVAFQIAKALECTHKNNIIHRDIKPDNILITEDNLVKVTDFGIAKVEKSATITNSNKIMGSVHYFSPEQAKGKLVDCRTDIYSLGIVMYEMVTGRVPYDAQSSVAIAIMHINQPLIAPKEIFADIPENINQVILRALEKEPINRFQTAKEMAEILKSIKDTRLMDDATIIGKSPDSERTMIKKDKIVQPGNNTVSKNKKIMIIIGSIILALIIGISGKYLLQKYSTHTPEALAKTTSQNASVKPTVDEKKFVPSLIGSTKLTAENTIIKNGFLVGNISSNYSDSIAKGLVINQSPVVNTSYEKNQKIDLVISLGQKIVQGPAQQLKGNNKEIKKANDKNSKGKH